MNSFSKSVFICVHPWLKTNFTESKRGIKASRMDPTLKLFLKAETEKIIGFSFEVLNELGHGLNEKVYENSLVVLFKLNGIGFDQQRRFPVFFRTAQVGEFIPDLIAFGSVIIDAKTIERITDHERGQMLNYLRITKLRVGLILNFKHARLEWERIVLWVTTTDKHGWARIGAFFKSVFICVHPWFELVSHIYR